MSSDRASHASSVNRQHVEQAYLRQPHGPWRTREKYLLYSTHVGLYAWSLIPTDT